MRTLGTLLLCLSQLTASSQSTNSFERGEAFAIQMMGKQMTTQLLLGSAGKVIYDSPAKTYLVTWSPKDGITQAMRFRPIGKVGDLTIYEERAGNWYVIDTQHLDSDGVFLALQVDSKTNRVSDKGLLVVNLKRRNR